MVDVSDDREVKAAIAARDKARARFDQLDLKWKPLAQQRANAELRHGVAASREIAALETEAREARNAAWEPVVAANEQLRAAIARAQLRMAEAEVTR